MSLDKNEVTQMSFTDESEGSPQWVDDHTLIYQSFGRANDVYMVEIYSGHLNLIVDCDPSNCGITNARLTSLGLIVDVWGYETNQYGSQYAYNIAWLVNIYKSK
jgi:hypothetical protein